MVFKFAPDRPDNAISIHVAGDSGTAMRPFLGVTLGSDTARVSARLGPPSLSSENRIPLSYSGPTGTETTPSSSHQPDVSPVSKSSGLMASAAFRPTLSLGWSRYAKRSSRVMRMPCSLSSHRILRSRTVGTRTVSLVRPEAN
jgi:hypothetical protein